MFIDTHAHIYAQQFEKDQEDTLQRAFEQGVNKIYLPNIDHTSIDGMLEVEAKYPDNCFAMMGLHPCSVKQDFEKELYLVEDWLNKRFFAAVGEIGTDLYWDKNFYEQQAEAFEIQVGWAKKHQRPIVIHCRESFQETIDLLKPLMDDKLTGVFHCFTGSVADAQQVIELGFYLGIGGVATFKNGGLDKVLPEVSLEHLVLETDCPYLAPVPHRGKRNESAYVPLIAQKLAEIKGITVEEVAQNTTKNAEKLFA
ncbi:TatD family hydrolase [uncultured Microscilla sp.]|uniref:TatD family hydrolase n=1 Tax=uncultured Microscilla sp. TaxID=432653 RepID=UPI00262528A6|nr:TatD family hydrolase [uncultured Microscilla sp.]